MHVAFCYSWADEVLAHKIMNALKALEQEGLIDIFVPESYTGDGDNDIVDARIAIILLSRMFLQEKELVNDAFSCYGCGQLQIPILLEACDFKSIEAMQPHEVYVSRDKKEIKQMEYFPSDRIPLDQHPDEDAAIRGIVDAIRKILV